MNNIGTWAPNRHQEDGILDLKTFPRRFPGKAQGTYNVTPGPFMKTICMKTSGPTPGPYKKYLLLQQSPTKYTPRITFFGYDNILVMSSPAVPFVRDTARVYDQEM